MEVSIHSSNIEGFRAKFTHNNEISITPRIRLNSFNEMKQTENNRLCKLFSN